MRSRGGASPQTASSSEVVDHTALDGAAQAPHAGVQVGKLIRAIRVLADMPVLRLLLLPLRVLVDGGAQSQ